jgi:hypothetical protein
MDQAADRKAAFVHLEKNNSILHFGGFFKNEIFNG